MTMAVAGVTLVVTACLVEDDGPFSPRESPPLCQSQELGFRPKDGKANGTLRS
jgi:hypothetical protein